MNIAQLKDYVASNLNRAQTSIVTAGGADLLLMAINFAKMYMQRRHNFEMAKGMATLPTVDALAGANLNTAVVYGTNTPVVVKAILHAFLPDGVPITVMDRDTHIKRLQARAESPQYRIDDHLGNRNPNIGNYETYLSMIRFGQLVYIYPTATKSLGSTFALDLDIVQWLPDYDLVTVTEDFFSIYCGDFLMFRALCELNRWLKEDQAFVVSEKKMESEWNNLLAWDSNLVIGTADTTSSLE